LGSCKYVGAPLSAPPDTKSSQCLQVAMTGAVHVLLASLAVEAAAVSIHQSIHFVSKAAATSEARKPLAGECDCLNWKKTYTSRLVQCGQGYELTAFAFDELEKGKPNKYIQNVSAKLRGANAMLEQELCKSFYERMDGNDCARTSIALAPHKWWGQHWCYVSEACSVRIPLVNKRISYPFKNQTLHVPVTEVRVKVCDEKTDKLLSKRSPEELMAFGQTMGIWDPGFMLKVSYPAERRFSYSNRDSHREYFQNIRVNGSEPVVFDETDVYGPKIIVSGNKTWRLPSPLSYQGFSCIEGC